MKIKYGLTIIFLSLTFFSVTTSFAYAQYNNSDTVLLRPYGDDYREPKLYLEGAPKINTPVSATVPPNNASLPGDKNPIVDPIFSGFNKKAQVSHLRLDLSGIGKMCQAGSSTALSWKLNPDIEITDGAMLKNILLEAINHDHRIRRITVNDEKLDVYVLQPARIFGFVPVNYLFHVKVNTNTFEFRLENPKWLSYAKSDHANVADAISGSIASSLTTDRLKELSKTSLTQRHAVIMEKISTAFYLTPVYPYSNNFWICVFIPYFLLIIIILGVLIGYILYGISKKRRKKRARELFYGGAQEYEPRPKRDIDDEEDDELDKLMKAKKQNKDAGTTFHIARPRV